MSTPAGSLMTQPSRAAWRPGCAGRCGSRTPMSWRRPEPAAVVAAVAEVAAGDPVVIGTVGAGDLWKTVTEPLVARLG